ncbi:hypothetical protein, partial [Dermacoccus nishinomiyaensis]|uniref:hypothetical protein n=1 Tax=Dermacoccus nishinomiyaensis TaxID=1274 RepID=UPI001642DA39
MKVVGRGVEEVEERGVVGGVKWVVLMGVIRVVVGLGRRRGWGGGMMRVSVGGRMWGEWEGLWVWSLGGEVSKEVDGGGMDVVMGEGE